MPFFQRECSSFFAFKVGLWGASHFDTLKFANSIDPEHTPTRRYELLGHITASVPWVQIWVFMSQIVRPKGLCEEPIC